MSLHVMTRSAVPTCTHQYPPVPTSTNQYPPVPACTHQYPPVPTSTHQYPPVPASTRQIHQVRRPATHGTTVMVTFQVACSFCKIVDISTRSSGGPLRFESVTG